MVQLNQSEGVTLSNLIVVYFRVSVQFSFNVLLSVLDSLGIIRFAR